jgi:hypothetical protein
MPHLKGKTMEACFNITTADRALVTKIADRAEAEGLIRGPAKPDHWYDRETLEMDLTAANANGNPMDFQRLLDAEPLTFVHDIAGIGATMNRETGKLSRFRPRTSKKEPEHPTTTADVGLLIRDMVEDTDMDVLDRSGEVVETVTTDHVDFVDVSDPHNPRIVMSSGAVFVARIVREG